MTTQLHTYLTAPLPYSTQPKFLRPKKPHRDSLLLAEKETLSNPAPVMHTTCDNLQGFGETAYRPAPLASLSPRPNHTEVACSLFVARHCPVYGEQPCIRRLKRSRQTCNAA
jgi:hypothetical protein